MTGRTSKLNILILALAVLALLSCEAQATNLQITTGDQADEGITDEAGNWLQATPEADLVQIIRTGSGNVIQPISKIPPDYIAADEYLIATSEIGFDFFPPYDGRFVLDVADNGGEVIYVRAFNSSTITGSTYYGNSETYTMPASGFHQWDINGVDMGPAFQTYLPLDLMPPGPPISFEANSEPTGDILLTWVNTNEADLASVEVRYRTDSIFPDSPTSGARAYLGAASPSSFDTRTHSGLINGTTYYYSAFSVDTADNYSAGYVTASATSIDSIPPTVESHSINGSGIFLDIRLNFSEPMSQESAENAFGIYPSTTAQNFSWSTNSMTVDLGVLQYSTTYWVTEETTASDPAGNTMLVAYTITFSTGAPPPDAVPPTISDFMIDGRAVFNGDIIRSTPRITALISDEGNPLGISTIELTANAVSKYSGSPGSSFDTTTGTFEHTIPPGEALPEGTYTLVLRAYDLPPSSNSTEEVRTGIRVFDDIDVIGPVLNFPNPFSPASGQGTYIAYHLTKDFKVSLYLYDIAAHLIWKREYPSGTEGGHAGYNEVYWGGITDFGETPPNGIYVLKLVGGGKVLGTCNMTVLD